MEVVKIMPHKHVPQERLSERIIELFFFPGASNSGHMWASCWSFHMSAFAEFFFFFFTQVVTGPVPRFLKELVEVVSLSPQNVLWISLKLWSKLLCLTNTDVGRRF